MMKRMLNRFDNLKIRRKLILSFSIPLVLLFFITLIFNINTQRMIKSSNSLLRTQEILSSAQELTRLIIDMETGERGFLITGRDHFLEPLYLAQDVWDKKIDELIKKVVDEREQVKRLEKVRELQRDWIKYASTPEIELRKKINKNENKMQDLKLIIEDETGKNITDKIRIQLYNFIKFEKKQQRLMSKLSLNTTNFTINITIASSFFALLITWIVFFVLANNLELKLFKLLDATNEVAKGDYSQVLDNSTSDEFGHLSRSFNQMTQKIKSSQDKIKQSNQAKSDFLANMSHEIRTPMNGVIGTAMLLASTELDEQQRDYLETIRTCGDSLLIILNDILDFSKIEADKMELEKEPFDLIKAVNDSIYLLDHSASTKGLNLSAFIHEDVSRGFIGDVTRVRQIMINLLSNAIKFTSKGSIKLSVSSKTQNEEHFIKISVADEGIGISKEDQEKLFTSFSQVDSSIARKFGGTGLGLAICQRLAQLMNRKLWVDSNLGKGAVFNLEIPLTACEFEESLNARGSVVFDEHLADQIPLKILIAEDNGINQKIILRILQKMGYHADVAENGRVAIDHLKEHDYDLIFMDMQMPEMDGVTATKEIIRIWGKKRPKIIAMTANILPEDKRRCLNAGMDGFIGKPIVLKDLVSALVEFRDTA